MKKPRKRGIDKDLRPEYDLSKLKGGVRGKYYREATADLENDPRFLARIDSARKSLRAGRGIRMEDVDLARRRATPRRPTR